MRFRRKTLREIAEHITRVGLNKCPVCGSESAMAAHRLPVMLPIGGWLHEQDHPRHDSEANVLFIVRVECDVCGHILLFNSERFHHGDEPTLFQGSLELEDEVDPDEPSS